MSQRALIVDDNRPLAEDLAEILADEGYEVRVFDRPREALRACRDECFDVVLLDIRMPDMDGVELQRNLAQRCPEARFVLMTAYSEDERISAAMSAGVRDVLPKPIPIPRLLKVIARDEDGGGR
jgi:DNA-binding NtrC family response regulator